MVLAEVCEDENRRPVNAVNRGTDDTGRLSASVNAAHDSIGRYLPVASAGFDEPCEFCYCCRAACFSLRGVARARTIAKFGAPRGLKTRGSG